MWVSKMQNDKEPWEEMSELNYAWQNNGFILISKAVMY
jgi:hypothetical protein